MTGDQNNWQQWLSPDWKGELLSEDESYLVSILTERIRELMADDIDSLMSMLYRLDVAEQKVREALAPSQEGDPARLLACLIIDRQLQRAATRQKYSPDTSLNWMDI